MSARIHGYSLLTACLLALGLAGCSLSHAPKEAPTKSSAWTPPDPAAIPSGPVGDSVRLGRLIFQETPKYAPAYTGNKLSCNDCHIQGGTAEYAAPMVGMPGIFPMFNSRANRVISLEDRIQECFTRSESGKPLPYNGAEMVSTVSYIHWLSGGQVEGKAFPGRGFIHLPSLQGDAGRGAAVYRYRCAGCHGADGAGKPPILPALWGPDSYNDGAGMNQVPKMAAFVQHNMPQNRPGILTAQEAYDVSTFVAAKPRSPFDAAYKNY